MVSIGGGIEGWPWAASGPAEEAGCGCEADGNGAAGRFVEDPRWSGSVAGASGGGEPGLSGGFEWRVGEGNGLERWNKKIIGEGKGLEWWN